MSTPPAFDPPVFLQAKRSTGIVLTDLPEYAVQGASRASLSGEILQVSGKAFLLQCSIRETVSGTVWLGFVLEPSTENEGSWELVPNEGSTVEDPIYKKVSVTVKEKASGASDATQLKNFINEASAFQYVAEKDPEGKCHILGPAILAEEETSFYIILPSYKGGSFLDYCLRKEKFTEPQARFAFREILTVGATIRQSLV